MDILFMCLSLYGDVVLYVDMDIYITHMSTDGPVFYMIGLCPYIYIYISISISGPIYVKRARGSCIGEMEALMTGVARGNR